MAAVTLLYSTRIGLHVKAKTRLSIALHMAYLWLFIGLVLFSIQSLVLLLTTQHILGNSALHIINIGFFTSLIFIMENIFRFTNNHRRLFRNSIFI